MTIELVSCCYEKGNFSFPLGALCIKEALLSHSIPCTVRNASLSDNPQKTADSIHTDIVGVSVYLWNRQWFDTFVDELVRKNRNVILFAGGAEVTANPGSFDLDIYRFLSLGEGEESVPRAISALLRGEAVTPGDGIVTKGSPFSFSCPQDLSTLPSVLLAHAADTYIKESDTVLWELTRGCPYHCAFCFESKGLHSVRHFPMERIEAELAYLVSHHVHDVFVLDPTFNMDKERTKTILRMLAEKAKGIHFTFENRAELLDKEMAHLYGQLDCSLQLGMQSSDQQVLNTIDRATKAEAFEKGVALLRDEGITFGLDVIIGLPGDSLEGFCRSLDYAISQKPNNIDIFLLSLLPGTTLAERAESLGLVHDRQSPYQLKDSPTFPHADLLKALELKEATDLFYTKGQAYQWFPILEAASGLPAHRLMGLFSSFRTFLGENDLDVYELQDRFVRGLLKKLGKTAYLPVLTSYMELYQGIAFLLETGESPIINLLYDPNDLSKLETLSLEEFLTTVKRQPCTLGILQNPDGSIEFVDQ